MRIDTYSYSLTRMSGSMLRSTMVQYIQTTAPDYSVLGFLRSPATASSPSTLGPVADSVHPDV